MHHSNTIRAILAIACMTCLTQPASGQCEATETAKLTAQDAASGDWFGWEVSINGDVAVIGAPLNDDACPADPDCDSGSAYVFRYNGTAWQFEQKLTAPDAACGDWFGGSVSVWSNWLVIGAYLADDNSGSAYLYHFNGSAWEFKTKLTAPDGVANAYFGISVAISGNTIAIGASGDGEAGPSAGSAYLFRYNDDTWEFERKISAPDGAQNHEFGFRLAVFGDVAIIGDGGYEDDDNGWASGAAYVFRYDGTTWVEEAKLLASDGETGDHFGLGVSVWGDVAVIGADEEDDNGWAAGAAYVFRYDGTTWVEEDKLLASDGKSRDHFGFSVSVWGDVAIVGVSEYFGSGFEPGAAYVFVNSNGSWVEQAKLTASDAGDGDHPRAVSISGERAIVGAVYDDDWAGVDQGSAYMFHGLSDYNDNDTLDICDIADGMSSDENTNGIPDECEPVVVLVDIKPGSYPNVINLGSHGVIPVAILTTEEFDATTVDPDTVELAGASVAIRGNGRRLLSTEEDVDGDGDIDLLVHVETENLGLESGVTEAVVTGQTYAVQEITGTDTLELVPE